MKNRREFLKKATTASLAVLPITTWGEQGHQFTLEEVKTAGHYYKEEDYWKAIRLQFPLDQSQTYFNNGTIGPMPGYVLNKVIDHMRYYAIHGAEIDYKGNGQELLTGYFKYESLRERIGEMVNAEMKEIVLTQNATFGMNYVANGLNLKAGDEIINTDQEHGGGFAAWQLLANRKGCVYKQAKLTMPANDPEVLLQAVLKEITSKTKVIAIPHIISVYGVVMPVKEICAEAKRKGIFTILDGAQAVGQIMVDVQDIGCDAYYSSLHKWLLAPAGSGILYIHKDRMPEIWSTIASYNWDFEEDHGFRLMQNGTGNPGVLAGMEAAVDFYQQIGPERWTSRIKFLGDYLREGLKMNKKISIHSSIHAAMCAGMTTYALDGMTGPELQNTFWTKGKMQPRSVGQELLRHCVHIYNNKEEIDRALNILSTL